MILQQAEKLFFGDGRETYDAERVKQRFAQLAKAHHPDATMHLHPAAWQSGPTMAELTAAKRLLLANCEGELPCKQCRGSGSVRIGIVAVKCARCDGTGKV